MWLRWVRPQRRKRGAGAWAARLGAHLVRIRLRVTYATDSEFRTPCSRRVKPDPRTRATLRKRSEPRTKIYGQCVNNKRCKVRELRREK